MNERKLFYIQILQSIIQRIASGEIEVENIEVNFGAVHIGIINDIMMFEHSGRNQTVIYWSKYEKNTMPVTWLLE